MSGKFVDIITSNFFPAHPCFPIALAVSFLRNPAARTGEMAQLVKYQPCMPVVLSSHPLLPCKKPVLKA